MSYVILVGIIVSLLVYISSLQKSIDGLQDLYFSVEEDHIKMSHRVRELENGIATSKAVLKSVNNLLENGVYYDKLNDTIVMYENLDLVGEL